MQQYSYQQPNSWRETVTQTMVVGTWYTWIVNLSIVHRTVSSHKSDWDDIMSIAGTDTSVPKWHTVNNTAHQTQLHSVMMVAVTLFIWIDIMWCARKDTPYLSLSFKEIRNSAKRFNIDLIVAKQFISNNNHFIHTLSPIRFPIRSVISSYIWLR